MPVSAMSPIMLRTVFFLSFLPPDTSFNRKCCSGGVGLHLSFLPAVSGLIRSFTRRPPISDSRFCGRSAGWLRPRLPEEGQSWFAERVNEMSRCKSRMRSITGQSMRACYARKKNGRRLWRLRQRNDRSQFFYYDVWRTELGLLGARSKQLVFLE
jgi:hypothetical protein